MDLSSLVPGWDTNQILPKGNIFIVLVTCRYPGFRHTHKVFCPKSFLPASNSTQGISIPPCSKSATSTVAKAPSVMTGECQTFPGSSKVQGAGSDGPKVRWAWHLVAGANEENQSSNLKRWTFRSTSLPVNSYISQNPHSQTAKVGKDQHKNVAMSMKMLPL